MTKERKSRFISFLVKYKINYLILGFFLMGFNFALYELAAYIPSKDHFIKMDIDSSIPFIPEFYIFYASFYLGLPIFFWVTSFYDTKKSKDIFVASIISIIVCFIVFNFYNVKMVRPEAFVSQYEFGNGSISNVHESFIALVNGIYKGDPLARCCLPSLHSTLGTMIFLLGLPVSKNDKHIPLVLRIVMIIIGLGIVLSTFFIKQHYIIDAVVGFLLAIITYLIALIISARKSKTNLKA